MSRILGIVLAFALATVSAAQAQGMRMGPPPDHWITADSLAKAVGGDASVAAKAAPHLAEVDKVMKAASEERGKMMSAVGRPDQATMEAMRAKGQEWQKAVDEHLAAIRSGLDAKQQAAFDALAKPQMMRGRGVMGRGMGGGPPQ